MMRWGLVLMAGLALPMPAGADIVAAKGALLRLLDKMTGVVADYDLAVGSSKQQGRLTVRLDECRYPSDLPQGEAYAHLTILDGDAKDPVFKGWMIASSPALSALDNPRYDVWVLRCDVPDSAASSTSDGQGSGG